MPSTRNVSRRNLKEDFAQWKQGSSNVFSFCKYLFLLDPEAKSALLHLDAMHMMSHQLGVTFIENQLLGIQDAPFLVFSVKRDSIVEDALHQLAMKSERDLRKPLKVIFEGEEGVDEGGLAKEFFQLVLEKLFDPAYGMFTFDEISRTCWFNMNSMESNSQFKLIGAMLGIAIYNGIVLDLHFPLVAYKKLLKLKPNLNDLKEASPALASSLEKLLNFEGNVENLETYFEVTTDFFGAPKVTPLIENGSQIQVNNDNRKRYVDLYVDFVLSKSVAPQFEAFSEGFFQAAGTQLITLFHPDEIQVLIMGNPEDPNFDQLEASCSYEGYAKGEPYIQEMWKILKDFDSQQKKRFLTFCTGSDRIPVGGLSRLKLVVQLNGGDTERLPTASTCFNVFLLPRYSSAEKMKDKILAAIEYSQGFGLK
eukprot:TRINITY_DN8079_c2_g1_i2.p2 TRINITY_DN8079_c2_g1~~TRINITY_DN8079_c2_g1_i2.p2  ORF type:complete len:422 (+),score=148.47 TRINITY_DN8079_c2_g1_i2:1779-3044(+)